MFNITRVESMAQKLSKAKKYNYSLCIQNVSLRKM